MRGNSLYLLPSVCCLLVLLTAGGRSSSLHPRVRTACVADDIRCALSTCLGARPEGFAPRIPEPRPNLAAMSAARTVGGQGVEYSRHDLRHSQLGTLQMITGELYTNRVRADGTSNVML